MSSRTNVALQVFSRNRGISTDSTVRFVRQSMRASYFGNIFGRVFHDTVFCPHDQEQVPELQKLSIAGEFARSQQLG